MNRDESKANADQAVGKADASLGKAAGKLEKGTEAKNQQLKGTARDGAIQARQAVDTTAGRMGRPADHYDDILYQEDDEWIDDRDERTTQQG